MKAKGEFIKELEDLYEKYEKEVNQALEKGYLEKSTVRTYLTHSNNFIKWCKGDFEPGARNK